MKKLLCCVLLIFSAQVVHADLGSQPELGTPNAHSSTAKGCHTGHEATTGFVQVADRLVASCYENLGPGSACWGNYESTSCNTFRKACCDAGYYCY